MNTFIRMKRTISMILVLVMVIAMMPVQAHAATGGRESDTLFFATDLHAESSKLKSLLQAMNYAPGLVVLGGDHVNNTDSGSLASITSTIQSVYPGVQTFYTYAAHDTNVSADSSNPYAYARTGEYYEGEDYYVYGVDQNDMQSSSSASTASANFKSWASNVDSSKVIFVVCHMPIHSRRGDNAGGAAWMNALNEVGKTHDVVYLWGHNHTGENSTDTSVYFVKAGGSLTPQGGSTGTINFTYMNAGYIKSGYASMVVINDDVVNVTRYSTSGSATANYTIERRFAQTHTWEVTEYVAATCETDGYQIAVCTDCGETKTTVIAAVGHTYSETVKNTCTGSFTVYTCTACGHSYSEANSTETTYDQASKLVEGESYVIVASNYALTYGSSAGKTSVSVSNGSITSDVTDAMIWTYTGGKLYNEANGRYITASSSRISFSTSGASASYSNSKLKLGSYYLRYSSSSFSASRTSGSTVTLYQVNEAIGGIGEHVYETVTVQPTCTENGSITYTCTLCGDSYTEIIAADGSHSYESVTVAATCTEAGSITYTCACGDTYTEVIAATGHSYEAAVTAPTCTEAGFTTYICACGDSYIADEVAALGHDYESVTVKPTCTEAGSITYTCACGDTYTEVIAATGHSYEAVVTAPTCTEAGFTTYICACGDSYIADEVAALGHDYESVTVEPTCTEAGYTIHTCTTCGDTAVTDETAALGHSYESVATEATCDTAGYTIHTCTICGDSYITDEVAALGHNCESVVTEATCETAGYTTHTCTVCGDVTVDTYVAALGHDHETVTVEATCTEEGSITSTCVRCGEHTEEVIPALGHSYEAVVTAPTCTEAGFTTYACHCGDTYVANQVAALGHDYKAAVTEATCETAGYTTYTCACGDSYITDEVAALGHDYKAVVTEATCEAAGYTTHTCANCGDSYVADEVAALGHNYESVATEATCETAGYTTCTCAKCGDTYVTDEVAALGHDYVTRTVELTCTEDGFSEHTCTVCGDSYITDFVEAPGHKYTVTVENGYNVYTCQGCGESYSDEVVIHYTRVNYIYAGNTYVITAYSGGKYYALSHSGNQISVVEVKVTNSEITTEITDDMKWSYKNNKLSYEDNGKTYYLYASGNNKSLVASSSRSSTVLFSSNRLTIGSYYLRYSNGKVVSYRSGTTTYMFCEV